MKKSKLTVARNIIEQKKMEKRLEKINKCFINFATGPGENIKRLTALCGELLKATCALYNRLEGGMLCSKGIWHVPRDYNPKDKPEGHICYDLIKNNKKDVLIIRHLQQTKYAKTDPNVSKYKLQTYIGRVVRRNNIPIGSLCAVYQKDFEPSEDDKKIIEIIAAAISKGEEHRQVEEELRKSEQKFRDLVEVSTDWVWEVNADGVYTYVSPKVRDILGYEVNEVQGKTPFDLMSKEEAKKINKFFQQKVMKKEPFYGLENVNRHKDGHLVTLETNGIPILDENGQLKGYRGIDRDITIRKKEEEKIQVSENKYKTLLENLPQKIFFKDRNSVYVSCNENYAKDLKIKPGEIVGRTDYEFYPKRLAEKYRADDKRLMDAKKVEDIEEKYIQDGKEVIVYTVKTPVRDEKGKVIGILGIFWDITERKKAEDELKATELKLLEQNLALEQKNIAFSEVIKQIEIEKDKLKNNIISNITKLILPTLKKLKIKGSSKKYLNLLQHNLERLLSTFGHKLTKESLKLTPKELEICNMIESGLSSKEISQLLNISCQTIEKHRKNIRRKIGIVRKRINLTSYLQQL